ncbi:MAG: Gfo/Idh/MocA family oxidoreductase [Synergistetes bacterium]|nr:Gfo/Idh/MocA family oxidoreductase [Synergistota bacterium]MCX8127493.1 Gfo/Idh/MocA family oxidoreductase [Synergistota bacterium]MDW8192730.1 Gfo/Idh/MocA family oxidoreductase [Synergistota bacterium]
MGEIKAAVIGVGYLGRHHARIYSELKESNLVAVADILEERAEEIANIYSCKAYTDYREMLDKESPHAVSIAVPTTLHYEIAKDCLLRGINVLLEKPIATKLEHADELFKISQEKGVVFQVGYVERFNPIVSYLPKFIEKPFFIVAKRLCPFVNRNLDVGVVLDLMVHDIDIVLSVVSEEVEDIKGIGMSVVSPHEDVASAYLRFKGGCRAYFIVSRVSPTATRELDILDENKRIVLNYTQRELFVYDLDGLRTTEHIKLFSSEEPLKKEIHNFIKNVKAGKGTINDGRESFYIALKILEAMGRDGKNV